MSGRDTCRYGGCSNAPDPDADCRRGFCSVGCELSWEHIAADAKERRLSEASR